MATSGQFGWPRVGTSVATQFGVAANNLRSFRYLWCRDAHCRTYDGMERKAEGGRRSILLS